MDQLLEERLQKIESHFAQLEHLFEQLNQSVIQQGETLRRLGLQQSRISNALENIESDRIKSTDSKPPHYQ